MVRQVAPTMGKNMMKASGSLSAFMMGSRARAEACATTTTAIEEHIGDDLDLYLNLPDVEVDTDIQDWWCKNAHRFPSVAKMARQFLSAPATSADCERVFSKAGKMHDDHKKRTTEDLLSENLFVGSNSKLRRLR